MTHGQSLVQGLEQLRESNQARARFRVGHRESRVAQIAQHRALRSGQVQTCTRLQLQMLVLSCVPAPNRATGGNTMLRDSVQEQAGR